MTASESSENSASMSMKLIVQLGTPPSWVANTVTAATAGRLVINATTTTTLRATGSLGSVLVVVASSVHRFSGKVTTPVISFMHSLQCPSMFYYPASVNRLFRQTNDTGAVTFLTACSGARMTEGTSMLSTTSIKVSTILTNVGPMNSFSRPCMCRLSAGWLVVLGDVMALGLGIGLYSYMLHAYSSARLMTDTNVMQTVFLRGYNVTTTGTLTNLVPLKTSVVRNMRSCDFPSCNVYVIKWNMRTSRVHTIVASSTVF